MQPPSRVLLTCAPALLACAALPARAQVMSVTPSVAATLTVSDRLAVDADGQGRGGVLLEAVPRLALKRQGARVTLDALLGVDAVAASVGEARARAYPQLSAKGAAELVQHVLRFDVAADLHQEALSPLARRTAGLGADRRLTTFAWHAGPRLRWEWRPGWLLLGDALVAGSRVVQGEAADGERPASFGQAQRLRLERLPLPLGGALEVRRQRSRDQRRDVEVLAVDALRADLGYAITDELFVWGIAGHEDVQLESGRDAGGVHGARLLWRPGLRTLLDATALHRFFGTGWTLQLRHRNPWFGFELKSRRDASTPGGAGIGTLDTNTPVALLDSMLSTRHSDPAVRRALVQDFAQAHPQLLVPVAAYGVTAARPQLERTIDAQLLLLGRRDSASLSAYDRRLSPLPGSGAGAPGLLDSLRSERGMAAAWSHRLTPQQELNLRYAQSRTRLAGAEGGAQERELLGGWSVALQPRLRLHVGLKLARHKMDQGAAVTERAAIVGLSYSR